MILRNAAVSWIAQATSQLAALVLTPLMIHYLGEDAYGVWYLLVSVSYLLSSLDLGLSTAVVRYVAARLATGDHSGVLNFANTCLSLFTWQGLLVALTYVALIFWADSIFRIPEELAGPARLVLICLAVSSSLSFPARLYGSLLGAKERFDVMNLVDTLTILVRFGVLMVVFAMGGRLVAVGLTHAGVLVLSYLAITAAAFRLVGFSREVRLGWHRPDVRKAITYGGDTTLMNISERVRNQLPVWLLGAWADPVAVARYGVGERLISNQVDFVRQASTVSRTRFSALEAADDRAALGDLLLRMGLYSALAAGYIGGGLLVLGQPFVYLWVGADFEPSVWVMRILLGPMTLNLAFFGCNAMLLGIGKHRVLGLVSLAEALVVIGLCWWLIPRYGVLGGAVASAGALLLLRPWLVPAYTCRHAGLALWRLWLAGPLRALAALMVPVGLCGLLVWWRPVTSWLGLLWAGLAYTALCGVGVWAIGFGPWERNYWKRMLGDLRERRRKGSGRNGGQDD